MGCFPCAQSSLSSFINTASSRPFWELGTSTNLRTHASVARYGSVKGSGSSSSSSSGVLCGVPSPATEVEFDVQLVGRSVRMGRVSDTVCLCVCVFVCLCVWVGDARAPSCCGRGGVGVPCPARRASFCESVPVLVHVGPVAGDGVCQLVVTQRLELEEGIPVLQEHVLKRRGQVHLLIKGEVPRPPVHDRRVASHRRDACLDGGELPGHVMM